MSKRRLFAILFGVVLFSYISSFSNPFIWDDEQFITQNTYVQTFDIVKIFTTNTVAGAGVVSNYYRPLTTVSFAVDHAIWGQNTFGFHLTNVMFHAGAGILLFLLLLELGVGQWPGFFMTLFFLIHPLQTEAITYINSRGDSLYTFFLFLSLLLFTKLLHKKIGRWGVFVIIGTFICSLLSKEIALAGIVLYGCILGIYLLKGKTIKKQQYPLLGLGGIVMSVVTYIALRLTLLNFANTLNFYGVTNDYTRSLAIRLFTFAKVVWIYISLFFWPYPLHMERDVAWVRTFFSPWVIGLAGLILGLLLLGVWEVKKKKTGWIIFGLVWLLGMLVPGSGIIPINGILYEHWMYVPMVGLCLIIYGLWNLFLAQVHIHKILISFGIVLSILYIILTIRQNTLWSDPITFYTYTLSFGESGRVENNLAMSYADKGDYSQAIVHYKKSIALLNYSQAHYNLANAYVAIHKLDLAEQEYHKALHLDPQFALAYPALTNLYFQEEKYSQALISLQKSGQFFAKGVKYYLALGQLYRKLHMNSASDKAFSQALQMSGNDPGVAAAIEQLQQDTN